MVIMKFNWIKLLPFICLYLLPNAFAFASNNPNGGGGWKQQQPQIPSSSSSNEPTLFKYNQPNNKYHLNPKSTQSSYPYQPQQSFVATANRDINNYKYSRRTRIPSLNQGLPTSRNGGYGSSSATGSRGINYSPLGLPRPSPERTYQGPGSIGFRPSNYPNNNPRNRGGTNVFGINNQNNFNQGRNFNNNNKKRRRNKTPVRKYYPETPTYTSKRKRKKANDPNSTSGFGGSSYPTTSRGNNNGYDDVSNDGRTTMSYYPDVTPPTTRSRRPTTGTNYYPSNPNFFTPKDIYYPPTPKVSNTYEPPSSRPKDPKLEARIAELRNELESKERMLKEVQNEVDGFTTKSKNIIRALRSKRSYFYDTLMLKTIKYVNTYDRDIEKQLRQIEDAKRELDSKSLRAYPWKLSYIEKRIRKNNLIADSDKLAIKTSAKISELNLIVDDMTREQQLSIPNNNLIKPCLHPHHKCLPHDGPHYNDDYNINYSNGNNYLG